MGMVVFMQNELFTFLDAIQEYESITQNFLDQIELRLLKLDIFHDEVSEYIFSIKDEQDLFIFSAKSEIVLMELMNKYKAHVSVSNESLNHLSKSINQLMISVNGKNRKNLNEQASIRITDYMNKAIVHLDVAKTYDKCKQLLDSIQIWSTISQKNNEIYKQTEESIQEVKGIFNDELEKAKLQIEAFTEKELSTYSKAIEDKDQKMNERIEGYGEKMTTLSITILGIFTGISFLVTGGVNLTSTILSSNGSMANIMMRWSMLGFGIFSLLLLLLYGVSDLIGKRIFDKKSKFIKFVYIMCFVIFLIGALLDYI